jgi:ABC-type branched-subunit amino acid transport system ATPase component
MPEPLLRLQGLRKKFGSLVVTDDVTLDVMPAKCTPLSGRTAPARPP